MQMEDSNEDMLKKKFLQAYDQCADAIYRHLFFKTCDTELSKDLMQETFMKTWQYMAAGKQIENIKAFLYKIAGNLVIDHSRKKKEMSLEALEEAGVQFGNNDDEGVDKVELERLRVAVEKLPVKYREIIVLRYVDDLSLQEIAHLKDVSENVVSVRINRGVKKLRKILEK